MLAFQTHDLGYQTRNTIHKKIKKPYPQKIKH
jgi:hypothetical protein